MNQQMVSSVTCAHNIHSFNNFSIVDIVRARVRTFGVEEHKFVLENGAMGMGSRSFLLGITNDSFRCNSRV
jgi:hypothetical protein